MSRTLLLVLVLVGGLLIGGATADAHHSFAATYITDKEIRIEGDLIQFMFRNPHSFVHIEAPGDDGQMHRWAVEWGGAGALAGQGVMNQTLRVGDVVKITGNPGREADDYRLRMQYLRRDSDGFEWGKKPGETFQ